MESLPIYEVLTHGNSIESSSEVHQLLGCEHLLKWDVLHPEVGPNSLRPLHGFLEQTCGISKLQLWNLWQHVRVLEEWLLWASVGILVLDLGVDTSLGLIVDPLSNEELVLLAIEVRSLTFSLVVDPVAFEVVTVSLGQHSVAISLTFMPLTFIDVSVGVDHSSLTLRHTVDPVTIVPVAIFEEESTSTMLLVLEPIASVLSAKLIALIPPVGSLAMFLVHSPHTFILISILVELDTEAFFAVVSPVTDVSAGSLPHLTLDTAILLPWLLLYPVDTSMWSVLLSLGIPHLPKVDEWWALL